MFLGKIVETRLYNIASTCNFSKIFLLSHEKFCENLFSSFCGDNFLNTPVQMGFLYSQIFVGGDAIHFCNNGQKRKLIEWIKVYLHQSQRN